MGYSNKAEVFKTHTVFYLFDSASVDKLLDGVKSAAEVTAKDCLKVFVLNPPTVRDDAFPTVETK